MSIVVNLTHKPYRLLSSGAVLAKRIVEDISEYAVKKNAISETK